MKKKNLIIGGIAVLILVYFGFRSYKNIEAQNAKFPEYEKVVQPSHQVYDEQKLKKTEELQEKQYSPPLEELEYYIGQETIGAYSKESFEELFRYIRDKDQYAVNFMVLNGDARILEKGNRVFVVNNKFSFTIVREIGTTRNLWIVTEALTKKSP